MNATDGSEASLASPPLIHRSVNRNRPTGGGVHPKPRAFPYEPAGAQEAFDQFVRDTYPRLVGMIEIVVKDRATAEDIAQETYARAFLNWPKLWPDGNPIGWCYRVSVNLGRSWWRGIGRESRALGRVGNPTSNPAVEPDVDLMRAVARLPRRQRIAVSLHYTVGLSVEEVAETMRVRPGTVKSMLHAARQRLREQLRDS